MADWNDDGKLDLLVGDLILCKAPDRVVTEADLERKKQLEKQYEKSLEQLREYTILLEAKTYEALGITDAKKMTKEQQDLAMKRFQDPQYMRLSRGVSQLGSQLQDYDEPFPERYGFV